MKRIILALTLLIILLIQPLPGAITKTTSIVEVDAWQLVGTTALVVGNAYDIHLSYATKVYLEIAYSHDNDQSGVEYIVEISYADDNWVQLIRRTTIGDNPATTQTSEDPMSAGDTTVGLDDAGTGDFDVPGRKWFILDSTVGLSESVKTKSEAGNVVTLVHDTLRQHAVDSNCYDFVFETTISIPMAASYVRVLINNTDADATIHFTTRVSKVTGI